MIEPSVCAETDTRMSSDDPAAAVLDLLCESMRALNDGLPIDDVICVQLCRALGADAAAVVAIHPDLPPELMSSFPPGPAACALESHLLHGGAFQQPHFTVEFIHGLGHVVVMQLDAEAADPHSQIGARVLAFARSRPYEPTDRRLLERTFAALVDLWPHADRSYRAHQEHEWMRLATEERRMTERELQVLELLADGLLATSIAARLRLSPRTVHKHLGNIYRKLGVHDRLVAVSLARMHGLVGAFPSSPVSPARV